MEAQRNIPSFGIFAALTVCGAFPAFLHSVYSSGSVSLGAFAGAQVIVFLTACVIYRVRGDRLQTRLTVTTAALYLVFFLFAVSAMLTELAVFLASFTRVNMRFAAFIIALAAACAGASRRGIVNVCRCAVVFFAITAAIDILGCSLLSLRIDAVNFRPQTISASELFRAICAAVSQLAVIPVFFMFEGQLPKDCKKPMLLYVMISSAFFAAFSLISLGVLGDYSKLVRFPFYAAAQSAGVGAFTRLDVLFLCARAIGAFSVLMLYFCAIGRTGALLFGEKSSGKVIFIGAAAACAVVFAAMRSDAVRVIFTDSRVMAAGAVIFCAVIPVLSGTRVRRHAKRAAVATAALIVCVLLSGCGDVQLQDRMIIKGVGIDKYEDRFNVTIQYIDNYSDGDKQVNRVISVIGKSVSEAIGRIKDSTGSEPFLGQNSAVIIGSQTASGNLYALLDYFVEYSESRPTARFYLSKTTAADVLSFTKDGQIVPIDHLTSISPSSSVSDNKFTVMSISNSIISKTDTPSAAVLGIIGDEIRLSALSYISDGEIKRLDKDGYLAYCMMTGTDSESVITIGDISCEIDKCKTKVHSGVHDGRLFFKIECRPTLSIKENPRNVEKDVIQRRFESYFEELLQRSTQKMINEECCDIYGFGTTLTAKAVEGFKDREDYAKGLRLAAVAVDVRCGVEDN